ncbi:MAG: hypothetical protein H7239_08645 [Flavobacterium sp.]|nr:hypothetical protein [Flavobacterium sp.]
MKKRRIIILTFLLFISFQNFSQEIKTGNDKLVIDSLKFPRQKNFQEHVDMLFHNKYLGFEEEKKINYYDILDTPEKAKMFAINLGLMRYPKNKYYIENYVKISEDKTKKLWFIMTRLGEPGKVFDGDLSIIVKKNDCSVIMFTNHF